MHIEKHIHPDFSESELRRVFDPADGDVRQRLADAYQHARTKDTLVEVKQVEFDLEGPCPCQSRKKAKNCCSGRLLRQMAARKKIGSVAG